MKLKKGLDAFLESVPAVVPRTEVVQLIRRYGSRTRAVSHYRTYGKGYVAVRKFLDAIGLSEGKDYDVVRSEFDQDTVQIRWSQSRGAKSFMHALRSVDSACVNRLAGLVAAQKTVDEIRTSGVLGSFPEGSDEAGTDESKALGVDFGKAVHALLMKASEYYDEYDVADLDCCDGLENLIRYRDSVSGVLGPDSLELLVQFDPAAYKTLREEFPTLPKRLLFGHQFNATRCLHRFLRDGEKVMGYEMMMSTATGDIFRGDARENPMVGYVGSCQIHDTVDGAHARALFVRADAPIADADALAWIAEDYPRFWKYVSRLCELCYGKVHCRVMPQSRIGILNGRAGAGDSASLGSDGLAFTRDALANESIDYNTSPVAMMALLFTGSPIPENSNVTETRDETAPLVVTHVAPPDLASRLFAGSHLDTGDDPAEWFALAHGMVFSGRPLEDADSGRYGNVLKFRAQLSGLAAENGTAGICAFVRENSGICSAPGGDYGPASAFYGSILAAVRSRVDDPPRSAADGRPDGVGLHTDGPVITAVYSGVTNEKSPTMDAEPSAFPELGGTTAKAIVEGKYLPAAKKMFTKTVESFVKDGTQLKSAEGRPAEKRWIVVETNIDGPAFLKKVGDPDVFTSDLASSFLRCIVMRNPNPLCVVSDEDRNAKFSLAHADLLENALKRSQYGYALRSTDIRVTGTYRDLFCREDHLRFDKTYIKSGERGIKVQFALDNADRLYFVFSVEGDYATWATAGFRLAAGLPVHPAWMMRKYLPAGTGCERVDGTTVFVSERSVRTTAAMNLAFSVLLENTNLAEWDTVRDSPSYGPVVLAPRRNSVGSRYITRDAYLESFALGVPA